VSTNTFLNSDDTKKQAAIFLARSILSIRNVLHRISTIQSLTDGATEFQCPPQAAATEATGEFLGRGSFRYCYPLGNQSWLLGDRFWEIIYRRVTLTIILVSTTRTLPPGVPDTSTWNIPAALPSILYKSSTPQRKQHATLKKSIKTNYGLIQTLLQLVRLLGFGLDGLWGSQIEEIRWVFHRPEARVCSLCSKPRSRYRENYFVELSHTQELGICSRQNCAKAVRGSTSPAVTPPSFTRFKSPLLH